MLTRLAIADLLKGIAVFFMIQVHIIELFAHETIYNSSQGKWLLFFGGPIVAPVFMVIMGYFLAKSEKTTKTLVLRGVKVFCLGMFLNLALNFNLILSVAKGIYHYELLPYIFGVDVLLFAGLAIILLSMVRVFLTSNLILTISLILLCVISGDFIKEYLPQNSIIKYVSAFFYGTVNWSYFPILPWLAYPLTGFVVHQLNQTHKIDSFASLRIKVATAFCFAVFLTLTINFGISVSSQLSNYYHHGFVFYLWTIVFLFFYVFFVNEINKLLSDILLFRFLRWLGMNVTIVYLVQWVIIGNVATEIYKSISSPVYLGLCFIGILSISSLMCYFINRVRGQRF